MLMCLECNEIFDEPKRWVEDHCLDSPPYEEWLGCPWCGGTYIEAHKCDCCGDWIVTENYIKTNDGERFCEDCITHMRLGDEN